MRRQHNHEQWRDHELAERLAGLEVPEPAPGFFESLQARLASEAARRPVVRQGRPYRQQRVARRRRARIVWIPLASAAAVALLIWALVGPLGIGGVGPETVNAAEVASRAAQAVAQARGLSGTLVVSLPGGYASAGEEAPQEPSLQQTRYRFVCTAQGDYRFSALDSSQEMVYDSNTGVARFLYEEPGFVNASESTGLASGPPDRYTPLESMLQRQLGATVRALRESGQATVQDSTYEGRPAWLLSASVQSNRLSEVSGDHLAVTVDQATGFPVMAVETKAGKVVSDFRLEGLQVDPPVAAGTFSLEFPGSTAGTDVYRTDFGFVRVRPDQLVGQAAGVLGYVPLMPTKVPEGFVQAQVTVAEVGQPSGKEGMNPAGEGVVSACWTRGFDRLVISTRLAGLDASLWTDPLASGEGFIDEPERIVLSAGPFAGYTAELLIDARAVPHLWVMNERLVLTVSGDLTREELLAVTESLAEVR